MKKSLLNWLSCHTCDQPFEIVEGNSEFDGEELAKGWLRCCGCSSIIPVVDGVPRFVSGWNYASSFGYQWNTFDVRRDSEDFEVFFGKTGFDPKELSEKKVLDIGCGGGRYARQAMYVGAEVFAVDYSRAVDHAYKEIGKKRNVHVIQADANRLPFSPGTFDKMYSIGVLHHTPNTFKAVKVVSNLVKPGGEFAIWLYSKRHWTLEFMNSFLRAITCRLPNSLLKQICYVAVPLGPVKKFLLEHKLTKILGMMMPPISMHDDWRIRVCDTFDWYAPRYQRHHTTEEVEKWFLSFGFHHLKNNAKNYGKVRGVGVSGVKQ